jgi:hypothetical protein
MGKPQPAYRSDMAVATVLAHEFTYSHPCVYHAASMPVLSVTSRGGAISTIEILISSQESSFFFFQQLVSLDVDK